MKANQATRNAKIFGKLTAICVSTDLWMSSEDYQLLAQIAELKEDIENGNTVKTMFSYAHLLVLIREHSSDKQIKKYMLRNADKLTLC